MIRAEMPIFNYESPALTERISTRAPWRLGKGVQSRAVRTDMSNDQPLIADLEVRETVH